MMTDPSLSGFPARKETSASAVRLFLSDTEHSQILARLHDDDLLTRFHAALQQRVYARVETKGLLGPAETVAWYYPAAEYLSDAAMLYALQPECRTTECRTTECRTADEKLTNWLRTVTLDIARTPAYDWVGPAFRDHSEPLTGHLETAHLCWALSAVYDLAKDAFTKSEQAEIRQALTEKGIVLCRRWLDKNTHLANWRGVLLSGVLVAAAVLGAAGDPDEALVDQCVTEWQRCALAFQPDGSYGESLQYGNYLAFALMVSYESLCRRYPEKAALLNVSAYGKGIRWVVSSMFYAKPLAGGGSGFWGIEPRARAANFNDSAALFRPSGDLLLHLAVRSGTDEEKGLARYLFDTYYTPVPSQGPHDLATFGMNNDWGFLTLPLLTYESQPVSPQEAGLPLTTSFSNGHAFMRDAWEGRTIVAINGGGDSLHGPGHLHGDLTSFILVHNRERLLVDPGHSCYRNLIHGLESSTQTHNTCTFLVEREALGLQEDKAKAVMLEQKSVLPRRLLVNGQPGLDGPGEPVNRGNRRLIAERDEPVSVIGAEAGTAYSAPIQAFTRIWLLAGSNVLFVVDRIEATQPVTTIWNWLVNNRDGQAQVVSQATRPGGDAALRPCLIVRRHESGMKLFHPTGGGTIAHPVYGYVHDAYHVEPNQLGEGRPGSGLLYRWTEAVPRTTRTVVHAIALDEAIALDRWQLQADDNAFALSNGQKKWTLKVQDEAARHLSLISGHGRRWDITRQQNDVYSLIRVLPNG